MAFFLILGGVFVGIGVLGFFFLEGILFLCVLGAFGILLAVLPQFVIFSRYGLRGENLVCSRHGVPHQIPLAQIDAVVLCHYDEYRRWKGFVPVTFAGREGTIFVPAIVFLRGTGKEEIEELLDLCETRTNTRMTFRGKAVADGLLDFEFLRELAASKFRGKVYVFESIDAMYRPAIEAAFGSGDRVVVYDRIPKKIKQRIR